MIEFIRNGDSKNRIIRILAVNKALNTVADYHNRAVTLCKFINQKIKDGQYQKLSDITYADIRGNCGNTLKANLIKGFLSDLMEEVEYRYDQWKTSTRMTVFFSFGQFTLLSCIVFIFGPIWLLSKLVQIIYPWIIVGYLLKNGLLFEGKIDIFQLVMLWIYIGLQLILLCLGVYVARTQFWLWHIEPGKTWTYWNVVKTGPLMERANRFYDDVCWYPQVTQIVLNSFGGDIGNIIMDYCKNMELQLN